MRQTKTLLVLFCYNRNRELATAIESINKNVRFSCDLALFDDGSTRKETIDTIRQSKDSFDLFLSSAASSDDSGREKCGGLYWNLQAALDYAIERGYDYVWFTQDDMQVVRPVSEQIFTDWCRLLSDETDITQVDPRFLRDGAKAYWQPEYQAYELQSKPCFAASGIFSVKKIKNNGFYFSRNKSTTYKIAQELGMKRVAPRACATMHLPFPEMYRARGLVKAGGLLKRGAYSYLDLSDSRACAAPPYAKTHLIVKGPLIGRVLYWLVPDKFVYGGYGALVSFLLASPKQTLRRIWYSWGKLRNSWQ